MKNKLFGLVGAVGLTGLLASCDITVTPGGDVLTIGDVTSFSSEFELRNNITDQRGNSYPAGTPVICDNTDTDLTVEYSWSGPLKKMNIRLKGLVNGGVSTAISQNYSSPSYAGSDIFTGVVGPGVAPLKLSSGIQRQAITVNPVITRVKGASYVQIQGEDAFGTTTPVKESVTAIVIVDCS